MKRKRIYYSAKENRIFIVEKCYSLVFGECDGVVNKLGFFRYFSNHPANHYYFICYL